MIYHNLSDSIKDMYRETNFLDSNTLTEWSGYLPHRKCGNTTRQIDYAIQQLFTYGFVVCLDHNKSGEDRQSNIRLLRLVVRRLEIEHQGVRYKINESTFVIKLED